MTDLVHATTTPDANSDRHSTVLLRWTVGALVLALVALVGLSTWVVLDHHQTDAQRSALTAASAYVDAMNAHDLDAVKAAQTTDNTWISVGGGTVVDGPTTGSSLVSSEQDWFSAGLALTGTSTPYATSDSTVVIATRATFSSEPTAGGAGTIVYTLRDDGSGLKVSSVTFVMTSSNG